MLVNHSVLQLTTVTGVITSVGAIVALGLTMWAIRSGNATARRERRFSYVAQRFRQTVELLESFEQIQSLRSPEWNGEPLDAGEVFDVHSESLRLAQSRYRARLWASSEPLVIARGSSFQHIPYPTCDAELTHYNAARQEGDAETEDERVRIVRGEILEALDHLRAELNKHSPGTN